MSRMCFPPDTSSTLLRNLRNPDFSFYREETALERAGKGLATWAQKAEAGEPRTAGDGRPPAGLPDSQGGA